MWWEAMHENGSVYFNNLNFNLLNKDRGMTVKLRELSQF